MDQPRPAPSCALIVFGAGGDLFKRLLAPAIYNLLTSKLLPDRFCIVGVARADKNNEIFRKELGDALEKFGTDKPTPERIKWLQERAHYHRGDFTTPATYSSLEEHMKVLKDLHKLDDNWLVYVATPPDNFTQIMNGLGAAKLTTEEKGFRRFIIEKPFGTDFKSAQQLNKDLLSVVKEEQIYRIDHYLGKETVQNILVLRFANGLFEPVWNRDHIDHIQITAAETVNVGTRGAFYDKTGALRDMVPNHLFQLLSLTAMEPPSSFAAEAVRSEKTKALESIRPLTEEDCMNSVIRGQYGAGRVNGEDVIAFLKTPNVAPTSQTATYAAMKLYIDNWRWAGVPFYLRTGKALAARKTEIAIKFKQAPLSMFRDTPIDHLPQNFLALRIQPDEGIALQFSGKVPGPQLKTDGVRMDFKYKDHFQVPRTTGYEYLIYDAMNGDPKSFNRADAVEAGWRAVQPILDSWEGEEDSAAAPDVAFYTAGGEGPKESDEMLARDGRKWRMIGQ